MDKELKAMLTELEGLTECGAIRSYYDTEAPTEYHTGEVASNRLHNVFAMIEEISFTLSNDSDTERVAHAERIIDLYLNDIK